MIIKIDIHDNDYAWLFEQEIKNDDGVYKLKKAVDDGMLDEAIEEIIRHVSIRQLTTRNPLLLFGFIKKQQTKEEWLGSTIESIESYYDVFKGITISVEEAWFDDNYWANGEEVWVDTDILLCELR